MELKIKILKWVEYGTLIFILLICKYPAPIKLLILNWGKKKTKPKKQQKAQDCLSYYLPKTTHRGKTIVLHYVLVQRHWTTLHYRNQNTGRKEQSLFPTGSKILYTNIPPTNVIIFSPLNRLYIWRSCFLLHHVH